MSTHTVPSGSKILVTGANGFIGMWVVHTLLEEGYSVRGTVRSEAKIPHVLKTFAKYKEKLEIVVVPDITKDGAFDEAVKDVDAVEHVASPFTPSTKGPMDLIEPAIKGTVGVLNSVMKHGNKVKRVVITSSCAAVYHGSLTPGTFSEKDWNNKSFEIVEEQGDKAPWVDQYCASKTLAEKAAWAFFNQHEKEIKWDIAVLNPPYVYGPMLQDVPDPKHLNTSNRLWWDVVVEGKEEPGASWIDVRDLAIAHVAAIQREGPGHERTIVAAGSYVWQEWIDAARALEPPVVPASSLAKGTPLGGKKPQHPTVFDTSNFKTLLGGKARGMQDTARDMLEDFKTRGWLK